MAAYHLTNNYLYKASTDIPATDECINYYKGVFVTKLKDSAVGATTGCQNLFSETDLNVQLIEDLSLKVDATDAVSARKCNITFYVKLCALC